MTISTFLLCAGMVMAQAPANRTSSGRPGRTDSDWNDECTGKGE